MIRNGIDISGSIAVPPKVCVIGSGPAGVTAAWHLKKAGLSVVLIEGSRDFRGQPLEASWPDKMKLYQGTTAGLFQENGIEPDFPIRPYYSDTPPYDRTNPSERERIYGGTSAHWGGQSRPLDPIDFEAREGFPGWPISYETLKPFYSQAAAFCNLYDDFSAEFWARKLNAQVPHVEGFDAAMYQFMGGDLNFSSRKFEGDKTIGDIGVDVILNASLLKINHSDGKVHSLTVASIDENLKRKTEFTVEADIYVLACGAVANARQLLLSDAGNEHDQVGRYFMCHPLSQGLNVGCSGFLTIEEENLMRGKETVGARMGNELRDPMINGVQGRFQPSADLQRDKKIGGCWFWAPSGGQYYFEQTPNPESRVTLADALDPVFNQPEAHITWLLSDRDELTFNETTKAFNDSVVKRGGRTSVPRWTDIKKKLVVNGHHIGTTRMSADPTKGVVDANMKVHSLQNMYVAGSSVFASAGVSNPTFTIVTLSIYLADHLTKVLGK